MASGDQRSAEVVDLTLDSDFSSDDDEVLPSIGRAMNAKETLVPLPPSSRASTASMPAARPTKSAIPESGSNSRVKPKQTLSAQSNSTYTSPRERLASSSKPSIAEPSAYMWRTVATPKSYVQAQVNMNGAAKSPKDAERSKKRRKLSIPGGQAATHDASQIQQRAHDSVAPQSRSASRPSRDVNFGAKLNTMNGVPSVHYMNSALKTSGSSILDDVVAQAPRPLIIGRLPQEDAATGLPSPGLTTPESMSAVAIDLDLSGGEEMEVEPPAPAVERAQPNLRPSLPREIPPVVATSEHDGKDSVASDFPMRQMTPRKPPSSQPTPREPTPTSAAAPITAPTSKRPHADDPMRKADHLLIFLKEVKRLKWADITNEFAKDIKGRNYTQLQSRYSATLNKRDRAHDPPTLDLPPRFAAEATIDWETVHAYAPGPKISKVADLSLNETSHKKPFGRPRAVHQVKDHDDSSGTDSAPRQRSRRAAPVDYTWPKLRTAEGGFEEERIDGEVPAVGSRLNVDISSRSQTPPDQTLVKNSAGIKTRHKRFSTDGSTEDAKLGLALQRSLYQTSQDRVPYLSSSQRRAMHDEPAEWTWDARTVQNWRGTIMHVDFSPTELQTVEKVVARLVPAGRQTRHTTYRRHLRTVLKNLGEPKLQKVAHEVSLHLRLRDIRSILSFLNDAAAGNISDTPQIQRLATAESVPKLSSRQETSATSHIRQRELGLRSRRGWQAASTPLTYQTKNQQMDTLGPKSTWTGASSDIHTVAWSPNGQCFAAGAIAVTDNDSMQYNRPNVLMYGDTTNDNIYELGEHCIDRPKTEAGANSTHAMYVSQDPKLYTTVSSVAFSPSGRFMYSAGYDQNLCLWDVTAGSRQPQLARSLLHKAPVDILAVNENYDGVIATATTRTTDKSIKLVCFDEEMIYEEDEADWLKSRANFASSKATNRPDLKMSANALKFDPTGLYLLAGFGANMREDSRLDTSGDICLWDVATQKSLNVHGSSRNVFDVTFNPAPRYFGLFAVGSVANGNVNRGTRSVVRFYSPKGVDKYTCPLEIECKAFDMNDILYWQVSTLGGTIYTSLQKHSPYDENFFAAGCTDSRAYIWDLRRADRVLYTLRHGSSLMPLQDGVAHERTDTGVRFLSWGVNARRLYSGSSDGVVKVWDVAQSQEDVFVKDLFATNSGIMSGAFSADYSKLVLGEVNGTANVLEVGRDDIDLKDADKLQYQPYNFSNDENLTSKDLDVARPARPDTAAAEARHWLETGQLQLAPMGGLPKQQVVQGSNYRGPFDLTEDAYTEAMREEAFHFQNRMAAAKRPDCELAGCADNINTTTYEDAGDSGRSMNRIPNELRRQWNNNIARVIPGRSRCTNCGRSALPSTDIGSVTLCERCSFTCFRCDGAGCISGPTTTITCESCEGIWDIGVLGFECTREPQRSDKLDLDAPLLRKYGKEAYIERLEEVDATFGDDMNALNDYYFGLAIDRPDSPPL